MHDTGSKCFRASVAFVLQEAENVKELRKLPRAKLLQFALDTCLVAYGIRAGYLVDAIWSPDLTRALTALLRALRKESSVFRDVVSWNHSSATQSFIVKIPLLEEKLAALVDDVGQCVFVRLDESLSVSSKPPDALQEVLSKMRAAMATSPDILSFSLPEGLTQEILVPLAAVVIDYPVAYVPASSEQTSFLGGDALDIYDVSCKGPLSLHSTDPSRLEQEHVVLKFSCPHALVSKHPELSPGALTEKLRKPLIE
ncbi:hypothetical protein BU15DRAFT_73591 [Melanogaster broomeanus]|nr:hypothetical protein BU15DRAFT_73591 [Melanogaster broomeanus]